MHRALTAIAVVLLLSACSGGLGKSPGGAGRDLSRAVTPGLTRSYAEFRSTQVADLSYRLHVDLDAAKGYYAGRNTIAFDRQGSATDLTIDFVGGDVRALRVNAKDVAVDYNDYFITVPAATLGPGRNEIVIDFARDYTDNGVGLYRYDDPDDGNVYLYTDFEPYDASTAFPLFDQPDLKARFTLSVAAPKGWHVISTDRESATVQEGDGRRTWRFPETPLIPAYIMSLHAGPYAVWEDPDFRVPLRLFARRSMAEHVAPDAAMWFDYTRAGFDYFEDYYGVAYPFTKYDQLLVPDFNAGAMENAGAVTYTERSYIQRDGWSDKEKKRLATVILHEMAHMWFGNLVTMQWWNDLWLNETFATFMAYHAAEKLGISDSWDGFFIDRKYYAYWLDRRRTTHPVEVPIPDTFAASTKFDSISYSKGGSVLRQLEFRLGPETFRRGIHRYLERHAFANATRRDLVTALEEASGSDLSDWSDQWLGSAGVNTMEARFECADGRVTDFALLQTAPADHPVLRSQKVQVGLFRDIDGRVVVDRVVPVTYAGERSEVPAAVGAACPDIVYPNHGDMGYLLVRLDPRTRSNLETLIGDVEDRFQRVMFWQTLWDNVRFAEIPVTDYLDAVFASAAEEEDIINVDQVYAFVGQAINYLREMQDRGVDTLAEYRPRAEAITWTNVERTRGDLQTMYLDRYLAFASSRAALERLVGLLTGETAIPGRDLDQDRRWAMLRILSAEGYPRTDELLAIENARDPSDDGRRGALAVAAARPDPETKRRFMADVSDRTSGTPYALQRIAMRSMFPPGQERLHDELADEILAQLRANENNPDPAFYSRAVAFAAYLTPSTCTPASVARLEGAMAEHETSRTAVRDYLIERWEDDVLCLKRADLLD